VRWPRPSHRHQPTGCSPRPCRSFPSCDPRPRVVRYWQALGEGYDFGFGSRFMKGGETIDYPWLKWVLNRQANLFIRLLFGIPSRHRWLFQLST
jgi:hypothetical protein